MIRCGDILTNNKGYSCTVLKYINFKEVVVFFENPAYVYTVKGCHLRSGNFKSPLERSVASTGFIGEGNFRPKKEGLFTKEYCLWRDMLHRCYNQNMKSYKTYGSDGVVVAKKWHNFQNFAKWCSEEEFFSVKGYDLDKDILGDGKLYSEDTCCFVPRSVNNLLKRDKLKIQKLTSKKVGVYFDKSKGKFGSSCWDGEGRCVFLGYGTEDLCLKNYKEFKSLVVRKVAESNRQRLSPRVYDKLIERAESGDL